MLKLKMMGLAGSLAGQELGKEINALLEIEKKIIEISAITSFSYSDARDAVLDTARSVLELSMLKQQPPSVVINALFKNIK